MSNETTTADGGVRKKGKLGQRIAYACGNLGQSAFYNAMSTYFISMSPAACSRALTRRLRPSLSVSSPASW